MKMNDKCLHIPLKNWLILLLVVLLGLFVLSACGTSASSVAEVAASPAAAYCEEQGGVVQTRYPAYGTNTPASMVRLAGTHDFCKFTADDGSRIYIGLDTLYTDQPTLAALAYLNPPEPNENESLVNPASLYCTQLGGSDLFGGVNAAGGAWVLDDDPDDAFLEACIFPDLSTIDSWGILYHQGGGIRGTDLGAVMRFQPAQ
ncbi:MAG: hypothetical protein IAF02_00295 [Anaerolineae bacterium]|nr:hypothetical protein [Anaerolineae bacterium]